MKLLVFAHTPPPHHGQSYMVKLMLDGLGGDVRQRGESAIRNPQSAIQCYHVNCRYSDDLEDIGSVRVEKMWLVLRYCLEAIWCRFRYGVRAFYYVPAPGKRAALYRDWVVMLLCRPFFRDVIHHWHAVGLGDWLQREGTSLERWLTHRLLGRPSLGLALAIPSMRDALWFRSRQVQIVPNGIPDPFPDFAMVLQPRRAARLAARRRVLRGQASSEETLAGGDDSAEIFRVLYLAHCLREKGFFDTLEAVALANAELARRALPLRCHLTIAGLFPSEEEAAEFRARAARPDLAGAVTYAGFVESTFKRRLLLENDALCFPTYYRAESFGLVVVEAMAAGLAVVTTRWRAIPELLPADHPGFVPPRDPAALAAGLIAAFGQDGTALRAVYLARFSERSHVACLTGVLLNAEADAERNGASRPAGHCGQP